MSSTPSRLALSPSTRARQAAARSGVRIEVVTVVWMTVEAIAGLGAGILARSVLLTSFGLDSIIELVSGAVLLWRLSTEARGRSLAHVERAEVRAAWITALGLGALCVYVPAATAIGFATSTHAGSSAAGIALAVAAVAVMPLLAWRKRDLAARLESAALRADAACSLTCAYLAGVLLAGLALNALFGWWWADGVGALVFLLWLVPEAREALENARAGRSGCGCGE